MIIILLLKYFVQVKLYQSFQRHLNALVIGKQSQQDVPPPSLVWLRTEPRA